MNKKINKLLAVSAALALSSGIAVSLAACGEKDGGGQPLSAPVISLNGDVVSWDAVEHADGYSVTVGSLPAVSIAQTSYTITVTETGEYKVSVIATSTDDNYTDSERSNEIVYSYTAVADRQQLAAPTITLTGSTVSWAAVPNATGYSVYIDDADPVLASGATSHSLAALTTGSHTVAVVATSADSRYSTSEKSNTVTYAAAQSTAKLVRLEAATDGSDVPTKTTYYLDEQATAVDLTGLALKAVYSDDTSRAVTITSANIKGSVDLGTVGAKQVTIEYTEGDRSRTKTFEITVKERTAADLIATNTAFVASENEYSASATRYLVSDGAISGAVDMRGNTVNIITDGGKSYVAASMFTGSGSKLIKTTGANPRFINVVAAVYITTAEDLRAVNDDLDGYYILQNDIALDGSRISNNNVVSYWSKGFTPIGQAPIKGTGDPDATLDLTSPNNELTQAGRPFTGTFDGKGHVIDDMLIFFPDERPWQYTAYYLAMFGYIGDGGVVKNFTLRNANVRGGQCSSLIAGVNLGVIENIVIENNCKLYVQYATERGCGFVADYNGGAVKNVVCHATDFTCVAGAVNGELVKATIAGTQSATATDCYIGNSTDLTAALGAGWVFVNGYGTMYGDENYCKVVAYPNAVYLGQTFRVKVFGTTATDTVEFLADWTANDDAPSDAPVLDVVSFDATTGNYTVKLADSVSADLFDVVKMFKVGVKVGGDGGRYVDSFIVTVGDAYTTGINAVTTQNIECVQGGSVNLNTVDLELELSDGSSRTVHPTAIRNFDSSTTGAKTVTFVYSDGSNEFTINGTVTVRSAVGTLTASLKSGVTKIIVPYVAGAGWSAANVDWDQYLSVSTTGYTVTPTGSLSGNTTFSVSKAGFTSAEITVETYLGVADAASFAEIGNDLAGWYILTADIDFGGISRLPIGGIPLRSDDNGTEFNATSPTIAGIPFTGVLDGNNKTLSNYYVLEPFEIGWGQDHFGGLFGYIGETGVVKNFTLAGAKINSVNYSSFVAGYNKGTISGITVNADCTIFANYGAAGAFAFCNDGTISDSVCYVTTFRKRNDGVDELSAVNNGSGAVTDAVVTAAATPGSSL